MATTKHRIDVSPEMLSFVGPGALPCAGWPEDCVKLGFEGLNGDSPPVLLYASHAASHDRLDATDIVFVVQRTACLRIFGTLPTHDGAWHMPSDLRAAAQAILHCEAPAPARDTLQLARSIELLCRTFAAFAGDMLVPAEGGAGFSELDAARIAAARRLIDERWQEKLTLDCIARACGLNRDKLARGFRSIYQCSVADLLTENRLTGARQLLLATDLPVSVIAYRCGYLNNASFTRAFARRFGTAPSQLRLGAIAA